MRTSFLQPKTNILTAALLLPSFLIPMVMQMVRLRPVTGLLPSTIRNQCTNKNPSNISNRALCIGRVSAFGLLSKPRRWNHGDGTRLWWSSRLPIRYTNSVSPLAMGRRSRRRDRSNSNNKREHPPTVMKIPENGVPEIAQIYPERYDDLLADKVSELTQAVGSVYDTQELPSTEVFRSPTDSFRMRANFKLWRSGTDEDGTISVDYVMYERDEGRVPVQVTRYPMGSRTIQRLMDPIIHAIRETEELRDKVNDIRFLTTLEGDALVTITYNRPIDEAWVAAAKRLKDELESNDNVVDRGNVVKFVGRSRKIKLVVDDYDGDSGDVDDDSDGIEVESVAAAGDTIDETLVVPGIQRPLHYRQTEGAFSQPNAQVCQTMLGWAYDATTTTTTTDNNNNTSDQNSKNEHVDYSSHDLCELYCGNGCFTVALAPNFRRVVATEMSKASVKLAQHNLERNECRNVRVAKLNAEDFVEAFEGTRVFRRLEEAGIRIVGADDEGCGAAASDDTVGDMEQDDNNGNTDTKFSSTMVFDKLQTLFVDPPRAGLDETCRRLASRFDNIVYVSCNPETLVRDLAELKETHDLIRLAAFDQFPYTPHLEAGVLLRRRQR